MTLTFIHIPEVLIYGSIGLLVIGIFVIALVAYFLKAKKNKTFERLTGLAENQIDDVINQYPNIF